MLEGTRQSSREARILKEKVSHLNDGIMKLISGFEQETGLPVIQIEMSHGEKIGVGPLTTSVNAIVVI